jgi:lipoprotein-releasing system permease protein
VFDSGLSEFDQSVAFINLNSLEDFFNLDESSRNLESYLKNPSNIEKNKIIIQSIFKDDFIYTWSDMSSSLFSALKVERNVMFIILPLIIIVAAFNIISGLTILVKNKTREIAILKSIGVLNKSIAKIFFLVGVIIGSSATLFGIFLGIMFSKYIENVRTLLSTIFNISLFPEEIYFLSKMPSEINFLSIFIISVYSYFKDFTGSSLEAFRAGNIETKTVIKIEQTEIINIERKFISDGILLKK